MFENILIEFLLSISDSDLWTCGLNMGLKSEVIFDLTIESGSVVTSQFWSALFRQAEEVN